MVSIKEAMRREPVSQLTLDDLILRPADALVRKPRVAQHRVAIERIRDISSARREDHRPNRDFLAERYELFRKAS